MIQLYVQVQRKASVTASMVRFADHDFFYTAPTGLGIMDPYDFDGHHLWCYLPIGHGSWGTDAFHFSQAFRAAEIPSGGVKRE